jgi:hypothetical protein
MRIRRTIIIPAIIALSAAAGSVLAGTAAPVAAGHAATVNVQAGKMTPELLYHG